MIVESPKEAYKLLDQSRRSTLCTATKNINKSSDLVLLEALNPQEQKETMKEYFKQLEYDFLKLNSQFHSVLVELR